AHSKHFSGDRTDHGTICERALLQDNPFTLWLPTASENARGKSRLSSDPQPAALSPAPNRFREVSGGNDAGLSVGARAPLGFEPGPRRSFHPQSGRRDARISQRKETAGHIQ